jgi:hypothetical protein
MSIRLGRWKKTTYEVHHELQCSHWQLSTRPAVQLLWQARGLPIVRDLLAECTPWTGIVIV